VNATLLEYFNTVQIKDNDLRLILPFIITGLQSEDDDYRSLMQMLVSLLSKKLKFSPEIFTEIMTSLCKGSKFKLYVAILTIISLFQTKRIISKDLCALLLNQDLFMEKLKEINLNYDIDIFLVSFFESLCLMFLGGDSIAGPMIESILRFDLNENTAQEIVNTLFMNLNKKHSKYLLEIIKSVQHFRFKEIDSCVNEMLKTNNKDQKMYTLVNEMFGNSISCTLEQSNTTLFLGLLHPEEKIRHLSVQKLSDISSGKKNIEDIKTFASVVLLNLLKDSTKISVSVMKIKTLFKLVNVEELKNVLVGLIMKTEDEYHRSVAVTSLLRLVRDTPSLLTLEINDILTGSILHINVILS
jgi:hypothetical protein